MKALYILHRSFIIFFFLILIIPFVQLEIRLFPEVSLNEKRKKVKRPTQFFYFHSIKGFKSSLSYFSSYMEDNFGFRNSFIYFHNYLKINLFKVSPNEQVVLGKNGWLFYDIMFTGKIEKSGIDNDFMDEQLINSINNQIDNNKEKNNVTTEFSIPDYLGLATFKDSDLIEIKNNMELLENSLREKNIKLIIAIAPNKHSIYPEYLPDWIISIPKKKSRLDQVIEYMNQNSHIKIYDYREIFLKNKTNQRLYLQLDTHLTDSGSILFANEIMLKMNHPFLRKFESTDFAMQEKKIDSGDLVDLSGSPGIFFESNEYFYLKNESSINCASTHDKTRCTEINNKLLPIVILYGDSFAEKNLSVLFKEKFRKFFLFSGSPTIKEDILIQEKPDFLIVEFVERSINGLKKINISKR